MRLCLREGAAEGRLIPRRDLAGGLSVDLSHEILEHLERDPACRAELTGA